MHCRWAVNSGENTICNQNSHSCTFHRIVLTSSHLNNCEIKLLFILRGASCRSPDLAEPLLVRQTIVTIVQTVVNLIHVLMCTFIWIVHFKTHALTLRRPLKFLHYHIRLIFTGAIHIHKHFCKCISISQLANFKP